MRPRATEMIPALWNYCNASVTVGRRTPSRCASNSCVTGSSRLPRRISASRSHRPHRSSAPCLALHATDAANSSMNLPTSSKAGVEHITAFEFTMESLHAYHPRHASPTTCMVASQKTVRRPRNASTPTKPSEPTLATSAVEPSAVVIVNEHRLRSRKSMSATVRRDSGSPDQPETKLR